MGRSLGLYMAKTREQLDEDIKLVIDDANQKLKSIEYLINPLQGDVGEIPYGFHTVGATSSGIAEFYVSGIMVQSEGFGLVHGAIKQIFNTLLFANNPGAQDAQTQAERANRVLNQMGYGAFFQARPIDPMRLMYGQALTLRYWAEQNDVLDKVKAIQIVFSDEELGFPVVSTKEQLLLDWVPFGAPIPKPPVVGVTNVR